MEKFIKFSIRELRQLIVDVGYKDNPTQPKRTDTLDVTMLFAYLHQMGPCDKLSYHDLRNRAMLLFNLDMLSTRKCICNLYSETVTFKFSSIARRDWKHVQSVTFRLFRGKNWRPGLSDWSAPFTIRAAPYRGKYHCSTPHNMAALRERENELKRFDFPGFFPPTTLKRKSDRPTLTPNAIARVITRLMHAAGIPEDFTPGDLRAATGTACYIRGVRLRAILDRGGWAGEQTFFIWYRKLSEKQPAEVSDISVERALRLAQGILTLSTEYFSAWPGRL